VGRAVPRLVGWIDLSGLPDSCFWVGLSRFGPWDDLSRLPTREKNVALLYRKGTKKDLSLVVSAPVRDWPLFAG
jgi:hypothetical protein